VLGIVLGAAYLLWLYQRVFWGTVKHDENRSLPDLNWREVATLAPLVVLCFWIGLYPKPFLAFLHQPVARVAAIVNPDVYGSHTVQAAGEPVQAAGEPVQAAGEPVPAAGDSELSSPEP